MSEKPKTRRNRPSYKKEYQESLKKIEELKKRQDDRLKYCQNETREAMKNLDEERGKTERIRKGLKNIYGILEERSDAIEIIDEVLRQLKQDASYYETSHQETLLEEFVKTHVKTNKEDLLNALEQGLLDPYRIYESKMFFEDAYKRFIEALVKRSVFV